MSILQSVFYTFALLLVASASLVILSRNTVQALLFLVLSFFASAVLWILVQAEFLALILIFVYVGAVMTLFLFVVMMLNMDWVRAKERLVKFLLPSILVMVLLLGLMVWVFGSQHSLFLGQPFIQQNANYSNVKSLGILLFTEYLYPFEIAGAILLVAMIAAIALAFHGRKPGTKTQRIGKQHDANKSSRLRIIKMKVEQP